MKTYNQFKEAAALAIPAAMKIAPYVIPALGGIVKGVSAITNRETGLSDSEKRRVGELMDVIKKKKQREKTQQTEKEILDYGRKKEGIAQRPKVQEQMVVPRSIKKKNPLMTVKTEMEILKQLSNRKAAYDAARTGKAMYPFSEDNKHREDKLNYQYKEVTNPKKPVDVIKALKLKKA